jgi:hypothetical protein
MKTNESTIDRAIRVVIGISLVLLAALKVITGTVAVIALVAGGIFTITGIIGFCGIYALLGISTCTIQRKK